MRLTDILMRFAFFRKYLADMDQGRQQGRQQSNQVKMSWDKEAKDRAKAG